MERWAMFSSFVPTFGKSASRVCSTIHRSLGVQKPARVSWYGDYEGKEDWIDVLLWLLYTTIFSLPKEVHP